jgi:hypothetical protein
MSFLDFVYIGGTMRLKEFCEATGATPRQVNYWMKVGMDLAEPRLYPGQGNWRKYKESAVPKVRTLITISEMFGGFFSVDTLLHVFNNYRKGSIEWEGINLSWRVDDQSDGPPKTSIAIYGEREDPLRRCRYG